MAYNFKSAQTSNPLISSQGANQQSVVYRIQRKDKPTIILDELSMEKSRSDDATDFKTEDRLTLQYPLIKINNYIVADSEIVSFNIDSKDFLPTISLTLEFQDTTFINREMPKDGDIISVAIRNKSDVLHMIRNDYVIIGTPTISIPTTIKTGITMTLFGELFVPGLKSTKNSYAFNSTSMEAIKSMAKKLGLGFATNELNTNDKQVWLCANETPESFIKRTTKTSWKDENSFYDVWIDIYYCLNFVNVNRQLISSETNFDQAVNLNVVDKDYQWGAGVEDSNTSATVKVFSNMTQFMTSPFYITKWKPINNSSKVTFLIGTRTVCELFEHNNKIYASNDRQNFWELDMDPIYDKDKLQTHMLLRGRSTQDKENSGDTKELYRANYSYPEIYEKHPWLGIQYTLTNADEDTSKWDGNQHPNYLRAKVFNLINNKELEKLNVEIFINSTNLNILKGDKFPIILMERDPVVVQKMVPDSQVTEVKNFFYSGWYYVKGFSITWNKNFTEKQRMGIPTSLISNFTQSFVLTRREWPTPVPTEPRTDINQ